MIQYDVVLKSGEVLESITEEVDNVVEMMFKHNLFIIQENNHPRKSTYIMPDQVSHFRFNTSDEYVAKPI